jgi:CDGSH-type Zn-finger protein
MKIKLSKGKTYSICTCGLSKTLPLCDNNHRKINKINNTNYSSLKITPRKDAVIDIKSSKWKN